MELSMSTNEAHTSDIVLEDSSSFHEYIRPATEDFSRKLFGIIPISRLLGEDRQAYVSYFIFCENLIYSNIILFICAMIGFGRHLHQDDKSNYSEREFYYISSYSSDVYIWWLVSSYLIIAAWFCCSLLIFSSDRRLSSELWTQVRDDIQQNMRVAETSRKRNVYISRMCAVALIATSSAGTYYIASGEETENREMIIAVVTSLISFTWTILARILTDLEKPRDETTRKKSYLVKLFSFRVLTLICLYLAYGQALSDQDGCILRETGEQFFSLMLSETIVMNPLELLFAWASVKMNNIIWPHRAIQQNYPEFDVSYEYTEALYRQLLILVGLPIFPLLSLMGAGAALFEIFVDLVKFKTLTQQPRLGGSIDKMIAYLFMIGILALLFFPFGLLMLTIRPFDTLYDECPLFE
eukprot:TRINITY_DN13496_c0_g1_i1.p1 TRINITY_DN13496_c0_g1~~TRINITY_DN13496_c0_g1_i1.p1  ORF type:complete len:411 (+),score=54.20 TRINITY_DN13496_c0_g1_i1:72-1304(+)